MNPAHAADPSSLRQAWKDLRAREKGLRARDAAAKLGVAESQLAASGCGESAVRLEGSWPAFVATLAEAGPLLVITRNEHAVIEQTGPIQEVKSFGPVGQVVGHPIDLRLFFEHWGVGFAIQEETRGGARRSIQVFDHDGTAVVKLYETEGTDAAALGRIVEAFRSADQSREQAVAPPRRAADRPDAAVDAEALRGAWREMRDTHEFVRLLSRFEVGRLQALRLAGPELAEPVAATALREVLERSSQDALPIMVFVASPGVLQIHTGTVRNVVPTAPWLNVLDPAFNLHVREDRIASSWRVRKPTADGVVTALELYDAEGELVALLVGRRKPGSAELDAWRTMVEGLSAA